MRIPGSDLILFHFYILIFQFFFECPISTKRGQPRKRGLNPRFFRKKEAEIWMSRF